MQGPAPSSEVNLSETQREILERWSRARSGPHGRVVRARILLMSAAEQSISSIARTLKVGNDTVRLWRTRWEQARTALCEATPEDLEEVMEQILADAPRPGTPATFSPEQVARIIAVACEKPADSDRPVSHWTPREVADEAVKRGIVKAISVRQVGRFFSRRTSNRT